MARLTRRAWCRLGVPAAAAIATAAVPGTRPAARGPMWRGGGRADDTITVDLPQLRYDGRYNPRHAAMRVLARELRLRTRLEPVDEPSVVDAESTSIFETPFLYVAGDEALPTFTPAAEANLRQFLDLGGLILFDAADGGSDLAFARSVEALLARIAPGNELAPVARDHVLFRSFYLVDTPVGRTAAFDHLRGVQDEGRVKALLMRNDLGGALEELPDGRAAHACTPGGSEQRQWAIRFGVNVLLYATCTDYKADRAHVETLLRSRRWR